MNVQEQTAIEDLFKRLQQAEGQSPKRDAQAENLIHKLVGMQPAAPYYMSQALLVQEHALRNQQARIEELEKELAARPQQGGGSFLGGLFGAGSPAPAAHSTAPVRSMQPSPFQQGGQGGGFFSGAAQTAMGVAGGVLLGNAIAGLFSDHEEAAPAPEVAAADPAPEAAPSLDADAETQDDGGFFDGLGGDFFGGDDDSFI